MRKIPAFVFASLLIAGSSCTNEPAETKKEVIVVPAPVEKKTVIVVEKDTPKPVVVEKPTSITVDKKGVKVTTKKINVDVTP